MAWSIEEFNDKKPKSYNANSISAFLSFLDRQRDNAEIDYDEIKDQLNEVLDFVILEKKSNAKCSVAEAKLQATGETKDIKRLMKNIGPERKYFYIGNL